MPRIARVVVPGVPGTQYVTPDTEVGCGYCGRMARLARVVVRLAEVKRAYRTSGGTLTPTSTIATMSYDGLGRRIAKTITNSADWNFVYHYYHDGQRMVEMRNASDQVLKQYVWGQSRVR